MNTRARSVALLSVSLLALAVSGGPGYSDTGAQGQEAEYPADQEVLITGGTTIYPNRADGTEPRGTTFSFVPTQAGLWILKVRFPSSPARQRLVGCTRLDASTDPVQWSWDGLDGNLKAPPRGRAYAVLSYSFGDNVFDGECDFGGQVGESGWVTIVNSTGFAKQGDPSDRASPRHVDLRSWSLSNGARKVIAATMFYQPQRRNLWDFMYALLGTPRTPSHGDTYAYQITYFRHPPPGWSRWMLAYTTPGRFDTAVHRIRCRGLDIAFAGRRVIATIPKRCLQHGNRKLRMGVVSIQDRHGHFDSGAASTEFVHYSRWSIYRPVS